MSTLQAFERTVETVVYGYIRPIEEELLHPIAIDVVNLCLLYFCPKMSKVQHDLHHSWPQLIKFAPDFEVNSLVMHKLYLCTAKCDFTMNDLQYVLNNIIEKQLSIELKKIITKKGDLLNELIQFLTPNIDINWVPQILNTIEVNICRNIDYQTDHQPSPSITPEWEYTDNSWDHLKLIYNLFWMTISIKQVDSAYINQHMTRQRLSKLIKMFHSKDKREREYLMMVFHKIYGKCRLIRPFTVELISLYFKDVISGKMDMFGVYEILQIVGAIFPGLSMPIQEHWKVFFRDCIALFRCKKGLRYFWEPLTQSIVNFIAKDSSECIYALQCLITEYWPNNNDNYYDSDNNNATMEELFIIVLVNFVNILNDHIKAHEYTNIDKNAEHQLLFENIMQRLFSCLQDANKHENVIKRAYQAFGEDSMKTFVSETVPQFIPMIIECLHTIDAKLLTNQTGIELIDSLKSYYQSILFKNVFE